MVRLPDGTYSVTVTIELKDGRTGSARETIRVHDILIVALGDSLAFGEYRFQDNPSNGDRGYVGPYADYLAQFNGGVRPTVINLGVDGETTTTFLNGGPSGPGPVPGEPAYSLNTNYQPPYPSQNFLLLEERCLQLSLPP